jgi:hypothetical protein
MKFGTIALSHMKAILLSALALLVSGTLLVAAPAANPDVSTLKTFGTMGKEVTPLSTNMEAELFQYSGKGCLTHMWFGGDWPGYDRTRIRLYVDGETSASIDMELGLGHGIGFGDSTAPWGIARIGKTGHPSGIYNTYQIPFGRSIRVTGQLAEGVQGNPAFWWIIRGTENLPVSIDHVTLPDTARLKLYKLANYTAKPLEEFALCNVPGSGALYQVTISARGLRKSEKDQWKDLSFLEACMRAYIGGKQEPLMLSSGLEDYFLGTYYFNRGLYHTPVAGLTHFNSQENEFSAYRFHEDDPVFFQNGLRLTCRCGEKIGDMVFHEPPTTANYNTYVWLYQW